MTVTSVGAWDDHYRVLTEPFAYGDDVPYRIAAEWVAGCATVEDWGCGGGWLRRFVLEGVYVGLDGSATPYADHVVDLATWQSKPEGIVMRSVLEHNHDWQPILDNALRSFTKRFFLALFTPLTDETTLLLTEPAYHDVPVYSFRLTDITDRIPADVTWTEETVPTRSFYGAETFIRMSR